MANIKKRKLKDGSVSYYIRAFGGYDVNGEQVVHSMTWTAPKEMSERQREKELARQVARFEESIATGSFFDDKTRFADYANNWLLMNRPPMLAPKTYARYESLLKVIITAIGNIPLAKLQPHHLNEYYNNLRENGIKQRGAYAVGRNLKEVITTKNISRNELAKMAELSPTTITTACRARSHISIAAAEMIAKALGEPLDELFEVHRETTGLAPKTILHHHRLISSILAQATRERLIPYNIADRNYMKAPKLDYSEAVFLDDKQVKQVLEFLEKEDIKWKTAMYLLIFSGIRRGELMGLEWNDIDFENMVIHIRRTSQYVPKMGIITKSPKNRTSIRTIKLSEFMFGVLRDYKEYWCQLRSDLLDIWHPFIEIKLADGSTQTVRNDRLFIKEDSTPMHPDSITDWTSKFIRKNKLPHFTPHSLRHTHATLLIANGINIPTVSRRLGHSSIATTTKTYLHAIQSADEIASEALDNVLTPNKDNDDKKKAE